MMKIAVGLALGQIIDGAGVLPKDQKARRLSDFSGNSVLYWGVIGQLRFTSHLQN